MCTSPSRRIGEGTSLSEWFSLYDDDAWTKWRRHLKPGHLSSSVTRDTRILFWRIIILSKVKQFDTTRDNLEEENNNLLFTILSPRLFSSATSHKNPAAISHFHAFFIEKLWPLRWKWGMLLYFISFGNNVSFPFDLYSLLQLLLYNLLTSLKLSDPLQ